MSLWQPRGMLQMLMLDQRPAGLLWPLIGFAGAALFGFVVLPLAAPGGLGLIAYPAYRTLQVLCVLQASLWVFGAGYAIGTWRRAPESRPWLRFSWAAIVLLAGLAFLPYLIYYEPPLGYPSFAQSVVATRWFLVSLLGPLAGLIVGIGIIRIHILAEDLRPDSREHLTAYGEMSLALHRHFLILAGILASSVIWSSAGRAVGTVIDERDPFPTAHVWQLAIYWSALLGVLYVSTRGSLRRVGYRLRGAHLSTSAADEEDTGRREREEELGKLPQLDWSYVEKLQSVFSVLAPIAGAFVSELFPP